MNIAKWKVFYELATWKRRSHLSLFISPPLSLYLSMCFTICPPYLPTFMYICQSAGIVINLPILSPNYDVSFFLIDWKLCLTQFFAVSYLCLSLPISKINNENKDCKICINEHRNVLLYVFYFRFVLISLKNEQNH